MHAEKANPVAHSLFTDLMRDIKRLHSHFTAIAYPVLNREGELRTSRWRGYSEPKATASSDPVEDNSSIGSSTIGSAAIESSPVEINPIDSNVEVKPS
jgi:hypothetical protein